MSDGISEFPTDVWSQPALDTTAVDLGSEEAVQRVRIPASITYEYVPGLAQTRFLRGLAQKKILGEKCPVTGDVYVPPRGVSPVSGYPTKEQVELPHQGTVVSFCVVHIGFGTKAPPTPFCSAMILLDGASVSVYGPVQEVPYEEVRIGMRVEAVWVPDDELEASFESIKWWRPIDEPDRLPEDLKGHM